MVVRWLCWSSVGRQKGVGAPNCTAQIPRRSQSRKRKARSRRDDHTSAGANVEHFLGRRFKARHKKATFKQQPRSVVLQVLSVRVTLWRSSMRRASTLQATSSPRHSDTCILSNSFRTARICEHRNAYGHFYKRDTFVRSQIHSPRC